MIKDFNKFNNNLTKNNLTKLNIEIVEDNANFISNNNVKKTQLNKKEIIINSLIQQIDNTEDIRLQEIKKEIILKLKKGDDFKQIQKKIEKDYHYKNNVEGKTREIIATELNMANNLMKVKKWKNMGFEKVEHITRPNKKVCKIGMHLDNKVFKIDDILSNKIKMNPQHHNYRCSYVLYE